MQYLVRHLTRFVYTAPISESVMELRMQPLDRPGQQCLRFSVVTSERAKIFAYRDHYGNAVHYFDIPGRHARLDVSVESAVTVNDGDSTPSTPEVTWSHLDALVSSAEHEDWLTPSHFARETDALRTFKGAIGFGRHRDPLTTLRDLNRTLWNQFAYEPRTTRVDSPIDDALRARAGVCQDFAHIMIALARGVGIPARYVSGYIAPGSSADRSDENATHAWIEAFLPGHGWIGFDPTNDVVAKGRHVAVAIGRDYGDVPPTRGVFKGDAGSELSVAVAVTPPEVPLETRDLAPTVSWIAPPRATDDSRAMTQRQQQQ